MFRVLNQNLSISVTRGLARAGRARATHRRCSDDGRTIGDHQGSVFVQEVGRGGQSRADAASSSSPLLGNALNLIGSIKLSGNAVGD